MGEFSLGALAVQRLLPLGVRRDARLDGLVVVVAAVVVVVAEAVAVCAPTGVDVASGVTDDSGVAKDAAKVEAFVANAKK